MANVDCYSGFQRVGHQLLVRGASIQTVHRWLIQRLLGIHVVAMLIFAGVTFNTYLLDCGYIVNDR